MAAAGTSVSRNVVIANIDGVLVQAPGGKVDVMGLVRRNKAATNAANPAGASFLYSNGHSNGIATTSASSSSAADFAVLRNNHQRYLVYRDHATGGVKRGGGYRTRIVAAIGPDGKTLVKDYRDVSATVNSATAHPDLLSSASQPNGHVIQKKPRASAPNGAAAALLGEDCESTVIYHLSGLTDRDAWRARRIVNADTGREERMSGDGESSDSNSDDAEDSNADDAAGAKASPKGNKKRGSGVSDGLFNRPLGGADHEMVRVAPSETLTPSSKRRYVRRQSEPKRVAPYHVFLRLFMETNKGQGPSFRDAAATWRSLSKEQQAQYVATPSQYEAVQSQNYALTQNKDGILTQEGHLGLSQQQQTVQPEALLSAAAVAAGEAVPVDTIRTAASPAHSTIAVKASLHREKRGRALATNAMASSSSTSAPRTSVSAPGASKGRNSVPQPPQTLTQMSDAPHPTNATQLDISASQAAAAAPVVADDDAEAAADERRAAKKLRAERKSKSKSQA